MRIRNLRSVAFAIGILCLPTSAAAGAAGLEVRDAWVHATVPGQSVAAAYMTLRSPTALRVIGIRSNASTTAEVHVMSVENGVMRMRHVDTLSVAARHDVALAPGGLHLMLAGLHRPLKAGDVVELEFTTVTDSGVQSSTRVQAPVRQGATQ